MLESYVHDQGNKKLTAEKLAFRSENEKHFEAVLASCKERKLWSILNVNWCTSTEKNVRKTVIMRLCDYVAICFQYSFEEFLLKLNIIEVCLIIWSL